MTVQGRGAHDWCGGGVRRPRALPVPPALDGSCTAEGDETVPFQHTTPVVDAGVIPPGCGVRAVDRHLVPRSFAYGSSGSRDGGVVPGRWSGRTRPVAVAHADSRQPARLHDGWGAPG